MSDRRDLRAALDAYVRGHDRVWEPDRKLPRHPRPEPELPEFGSVPARPRYGVAVPARLDFHRGPDTWRTRLPGAEGDRRG